MVTDYSLTRWTEYAQWFYYKPWECSELVSLGFIVASLLMVIVRSRQNIRHAQEFEPSGTL